MIPNRNLVVQKLNIRNGFVIKQIFYFSIALLLEIFICHIIFLELTIQLRSVLTRG